MVGRDAIALVLLATIAACSGDDNAGPDTAPRSVTSEEERAVTTAEGAQTVPNEMPVAQVDAFLQQWLDGGTVQRPSLGGDGVVWSLAKTAALPLEWPPTPTTRWVEWVYATGFDAGLSDATRVTHPWASVTRTSGADVAEVRLVTPRLTVSPDPQGVRPLTADEASALRTLPDATDRAVALTSAPDEETTAAIRRAYAPWLATNAVIVSTLPDAHRPFIEWIAEP